MNGFAEFMRSEQSGLLRFATALTGVPSLADDLVGNVLGRAYERWDRIGSLEYPAAYVRRMIVHEFVSHRRREHRRVVLFDEQLTVDFGRDEVAQPDPADRIADRDALRARLAVLPRRQRAALVLRYYVDLSDADIAKELGCAEGTVRSLLSRALSTLRIVTAESVRSASTRSMAVREETML